MTKPLNFQQIIMTLQQYWADQGFLIWQPWHETVGAGTANPGTTLRVLGPEPWHIAYVEPSFRPDDGRFGDNPNRMQMHTQFQVILQPDPGNPQELYLGSLYAIGLEREEHDIRFVEDNWESPALGAWGLGWEVWLDGMEISQYTYFQQAGGLMLDPVAVELTYGLERIAMYLQNVDSVWKIDWDGRQTYGDILLRQEIEYCEYNFNEADVEGLIEAYNFYERECMQGLQKGLVIPAYDYVLKCSHTFNILDTRGAIGVTERAGYFARMRRLSHQVAKAFVNQREQLGFPLMKYMPKRPTPEPVPLPSDGQKPQRFLLEIGSEELPSHDVSDALAYLNGALPKFLANLRLEHGKVEVLGTPRRIAILADNLAPRQTHLEETVRGPSAKIAFDEHGKPTKAAQGFARSRGIDVSDLKIEEMDGGEYVVATLRTAGRAAAEVLAEALPDLISGIPFGRSMRWLASAQVGEQIAKTTYSRPIRWLVALLDEAIISFEFAGLTSGRVSRGLRPEGSPEIEISSTAAYLAVMKANRIMINQEMRRSEIELQLTTIAAEAGGQVPDDPALIEEVLHLVEQPTALIGDFETKYLHLPQPVLITVMKKHQRYFPIAEQDGGSLLPHFIAVRNGGSDHLESVRRGNEGVLRARYADAEFFFKADTAQPLGNFLPRLDTLTFQEQLGSMLDKSKRLETLGPQIGQRLGLAGDDMKTVGRAAHLCKADLATNMVVEFTNLQGVMGYEYAKLSGEPEAVAAAIVEHYYPHTSLPGSRLSKPGLVLNLANRLDSLCGLFAVGKAPSGSADPFALRRDAVALVSNLLETETSFDILDGLKMAAALMPVKVSSESVAETADFVRRRLEGLLREEYNLPHDVVQAVLVERGNNPWLCLMAAKDLAVAVVRPDWQDTLNAYARCVRIVRGVDGEYSVQPERFLEEAEQSLYDAYQRALASLSPASTMEAVIDALRENLVEPINFFFEKVLVMDEDETIRKNRLALLQRIRDLTKGYGDLGQLQGF